MAAGYDERFVHFVVLFNVDEDYFECHEVMEELWLEEGRNALYQGLLQAAVGLHHWRNDNFTGAVKLFDQAENKLVRYADVEMGLNLKRLRDDVSRCLVPLRQWVEGSNGNTGKNGEERNGPAGGVGPVPEDDLGATGGQSPGPPAFMPFRIEVVDPGLSRLAAAMADIPLEQRLHTEE